MIAQLDLFNHNIFFCRMSLQIGSCSSIYNFYIFFFIFHLPEVSLHIVHILYCHRVFCYAHRLITHINIITNGIYIQYNHKTLIIQGTCMMCRKQYIYIIFLLLLLLLLFFNNVRYPNIWVLNFKKVPTTWGVIKFIFSARLVIYLIMPKKKKKEDEFLIINLIVWVATVLSPLWDFKSS